MTETADADAQTTRQTRFQRYSKVDLTRIRIVRATTDADLAIVGKLREAGFARVANAASNPISWLDNVDRASGVFSLIGYDLQDQPIATMRVQDGRVAPLELRHFVPLDALLRPADLPAAQFARLSVRKTAQASEVMFGLFKAAWRWCYEQGLQTIVIATPPWSKLIYDFMFFEHLGPKGEFVHEFAGGAQHVVMKLPVQTAESIWRSGQHPLCAEFVDRIHPNLAI